MVWNEVQFEGRAGRDLETSKTSAGNIMNKFSIAVSQGKDKKPIWLEVKSFEACPPVRKGGKIAITGRLFEDNWVDNKQVERKTLGVIASKVELFEQVPVATKTDDVPF